jgi:hypothetical protein
LTAEALSAITDGFQNHRRRVLDCLEAHGGGGGRRTVANSDSTMSVVRKARQRSLAEHVDVTKQLSVGSPHQSAQPNFRREIEL